MWQPATSGGPSSQSSPIATPSPSAHQPDAFGVGADGDAFGDQDVAHRFGNLFVLAADQARVALDDCHLGAEAAVDLREFEPDIGAADDEQMIGQPVEREHRRIVERRHVADSGQVGQGCAPADVEEDARRAEQLVADPDPVRPFETGVAAQQGQAGHAAEPVLDAGPGVARHGIGARLDPGEIDPRPSATTPRSARRARWAA